jgi:cytochrome c556
MRTLMLIVAGSVAASSLAYALDQEQAEKATDVRQSALTVIGWNIGPMGAMAKEEIPYDAERFALHAERIAVLTGMLPEAFQADTRNNPVDTEALDGIWDDFDEFKKLANAAEDKALKAAATARNRGFADARAALGELGQACKNCHEKFRED